ncbi:MAG TPA: hypothetical protein VIA62_04395 [Thermoanaerobaculia bacterium]|jgi:hypothetical protein|nr:hypothetical protein [Thermoanaerobaculia bacterium]
MTASGDQHQQLHGLRLAVTGSEPAAAGIRARLAGLPPGDGGPPDVTFEIIAGVTGNAGGHPFGRPDGARPVYDPPFGEVVYDDASDLLYIGHGPRLAVLCEAGRGRTRASVDALEEGDLWILSHPLFTLPLVEMLKRRGLYGLHAGGVCRDGRALLLPGTSGSGKTTLTLALARAGLGFLGDDTLFLRFLRDEPEGLAVLAFPDEFDLTDETVAFFPELRGLLDAGRPEGWRKRQVRPERAWGAGVVWRAAPSLLVFPRVAGTPESTLVPMDRGEALLELAPNVLLTEPRSSQAHLDALAGLVERSECWRLATGTDLDGAVRALAELMGDEETGP